MSFDNNRKFDLESHSTIEDRDPEEYSHLVIWGPVALCAGLLAIFFSMNLCKGVGCMGSGAPFFATLVVLYIFSGAALLTITNLFLYKTKLFMKYGFWVNVAILGGCSVFIFGSIGN